LENKEKEEKGKNRAETDVAGRIVMMSSGVTLKFDAYFEFIRVVIIRSAMTSAGSMGS
jgi:hypothetical protein